MKVLYSICIFLILVSCQTSDTRVVKYTGSGVFDHPTGLSIARDGSSPYIAVTNTHYHYGLILPFSTKWEFRVEKPYVLRGNAGTKNVSIRVETFEDSPDNYIRQLRERLNRPGKIPGLIKSHLLKFENSYILKNTIDLGMINELFQGKFQINYFAAKKWESQLYYIHYSDIIDKKQIKNYKDKVILTYLDLGFQVDFKR